MNTLLQNKPYDLGRYTVFPHTGGLTAFFTSGKGKGIDLDSDKVFEIFNGDVHFNNLIINHRRLNSRTVILPKKEKEIMILNSEHNIFYIFSVQPNSQPDLTETVEIYCFDPNTNINKRISITWDRNSFGYSISGEDDVMFEMDTNLLNHFAFEFNGNSLVVWANGVSRKTHNNLVFPDLNRVKLNRNFYGVLSLYHRDLSKLGIIEHYIKYLLKLL